MVVAGLTLTATPLVAVILPGVMTAVPPAKTAVSESDCPASMMGEAGTKLVIDGGGGLTVTVALAVTETEALLVTVSVYLVVVAGLTEKATPLLMGIDPTVPPVMTPAPPANTPVSVVLLPCVMVGEAATKLAMVGGGMVTVTVAVEVIAVPAPLVTVRV